MSDPPISSSSHAIVSYILTNDYDRAIIIATARVYVLAAIYLPTADAATTATWPDFLAVLEPNLNILCISLPMLSWIFKRAIAKTTRAGGSSSGRKAYYAGGDAPRLPTFGAGRSGNNDKNFRRMVEEEVEDVPHKGSKKGNGSIVMDSLRTRTETECRADSRSSDTGSEIALSPVGKKVGDESPIGGTLARTYSKNGKGITVSRSVQVSHESGGGMF